MSTTQKEIVTKTNLIDLLSQKRPLIKHAPVKVVIPQEPNASQNLIATQIIVAKDDGTKARDILRNVKLNNLSKVVVAFPQPTIQASQAPVVAPKVTALVPGTKSRKLKAAPILLEDDGDDTIHVRKRLGPKIKRGIIDLGPAANITIGDTLLSNRLPAKPIYNMQVASYYMNNREIFVNFINGLFEPYRRERDYLNLHSPYRGLLLYHGLGSGKSCSSIAIAEGMKHGKKIIVLLPAS